MRRPGSARGAVAAAAVLLATASSSGEGDAPTEPLLPFSTVIGGHAQDVVLAAAQAPDGVLWLVGTSRSDEVLGARRPPLPPQRPGDAAPADVFLTRFDPGTRRALSTSWLRDGGLGDVVGLAFDDAGSAYVAGKRRSATYETTGREELYVARLRADGSGVAWAYGFGGSRHDDLAGLCVTADGDPLVVGTTHSPDFPLAGALQGTLRGTRDAFVARLRADGTGLVFSTFLGGSELESATAVTALPGGGVLVAGRTSSGEFAPTTHVAGVSVGTFDTFLAEIAPAGDALVRTGRLGGATVGSVLVEPEGTLLLVGEAQDDLGLPRAPHGAPGDDGDAFLLRIDAATWDVRGGVLHGGTGRESFATATRSGGLVWLTGTTMAADLPVPGAVRPLLGSIADTYAAAFDASDMTLRFGTYLGGDGAEIPYAVRPADGDGAWVAGYTTSRDFPLAGALQPNPDDEMDGYLAMLLAGDPSARPGAPTFVTASRVGERAVRVAWTAGDGSPTAFGIDRRANGDQGFTRVALVAGDASEWTDADVTSDRTYTYAVQAVGPGGGSAPALASADVPGTLLVALTRGRSRTRATMMEPVNGVVLAGRFLTAAGAPVSAAQIRAAGLRVRLGGDPSGAPLLELAPDDPGWRRRRWGWRWSGHSGARLRVANDGSFVLAVGWMGFGAPAPGELPISFTVGRDGATVDTLWRPARAGARLVPVGTGLGF